MHKSLTFFSPCPKGIEELLHKELVSLGVRKPKQTRAGVHFDGDLQTAYWACLWSRLASRVLMPLARFTATTTDELYDKVHTVIDWHDHMEVMASLAVDFNEAGSSRFHSHYATLRV